MGLTRAAIVIVAFLAAISAAVEVATRYRQGSGWRTLETQMRGDLQEGSLQGLLRARIAAARILAAEPDNARVTGQLAFISAWLAHQYGLRSGREAEQALARLGALSDREQRDLDVTGALLALDQGQRDRALQLAVATARQDSSNDDGDDGPADLRPLLVLARIRALAGDPMGASKAAEAAIVREPHANAPLLAFAEARLDLGHHAPAEKSLRDVLARVPDHSRAILLLHLARQAAPAAAPEGFEALVGACRRDGAVSPVVAAACDLVFASTARAAGKRGAALEHALAAANRKISEPRVLAGTALVLAQLGRVDEADRLAEVAARTAAAQLPALAWARVAITLGRGELALPPPGLLPGCQETRLLAARAALIAGGPSALSTFLADLGPPAQTADADLRALSQLTVSAAAAAGKTRPPAVAEGPVAAYAQGLRARLAGDAPAAVRWLSAALDGHGDACRAAGEYLAAARLANHPITNELDPIRSVNGRCQNLVVPPPPPPPKRARRREPKDATTKDPTAKGPTTKEPTDAPADPAPPP
jgi:hypothetical protein